MPLYVELKCADNRIKLADALLKAVNGYDGEIVFIGFDHPTIKYLQTFGYPVCASSILLMKPPTEDFMPDGMLTNISFVPIFKCIRKKYPPFVPWTSRPRIRSGRRSASAPPRSTIPRISGLKIKINF